MSDTQEVVVHCRRCGRRLKREPGISLGIGPVCARREATEHQQLPIITDGEHLSRGDIWSNKKGWQTRDEAGRDMCRQMLPLYRSVWKEHMGTEISDDDLIDHVMKLGISPMHAVFGG